MFNRQRSTTSSPQDQPAGKRARTADEPPAAVAPEHAPPPEAETVPPLAPPDYRGAVLDRFGGRAATWSLRLLLVSAALLVFFWVLGKVWDITLPILLALLLSTVLAPVAGFLRRFMPAAAAAGLTLLAGIGALVALGFALAPQVSGQWGEVVDAASDGVVKVQDMLSEEPFNVSSSQIDQGVDKFVEELQGNAGSIAGGVLSGVSTASSLLVTALIALVLCFFFLKDGNKFIPWMSGLVGPNSSTHTAEMALRSWTALSGFIRAQALVGLIDAVAIGAGLLVLDIPFALPLAVLIFFGAFIPILGALVTGVLAALVALVTNGLTSAIIVVILVLIVQQLEGNVLQPILVGRTLDMHPALVILAVTAGGSLAGIIGTFLAVPALAVYTAVFRYSREQLELAAQERPPTAT
ncbi:AI-2E family transporter [Nocardioides houyundeii]|uniref:AI-2E family transporter n=1 Tax=Nocardioides houyundeii TaxID=2045452 RepID=UPI000DF2D39E|nr:AI-2E family transporter [Nocardioides houyundeii]